MLALIFFVPANTYFVVAAVLFMGDDVAVPAFSLSISVLCVCVLSLFMLLFVVLPECEERRCKLAYRLCIICFHF